MSRYVVFSNFFKLLSLIQLINELFSFAEFDDPHSVIVLAEEEIVAIDLQSENWPTFRQPYLASLHSSAITTAHHVNNVPETLWNKIVDAGDSQMANQSTRVCGLLNSMVMLVVVFLSCMDKL